MQIANFLVRTNVRKEPTIGSPIIKVTNPKDIAMSTMDNAVTHDKLLWHQLLHIDGVLGWSAINNGTMPLYTLSIAPPEFESSVEFTLKWEGGYVNNPDDPGGETNFGISKRSYPKLDIRNITVNQAKLIYYRDYWTPLGCFQFPWPKCCILMDIGVLTGVGHALTLRDKESIKMLTSHLRYLASLNQFPTFGRGWTRRTVDLIDLL